MKNFTALFVFTVLSAGQALKIQEKIVEEASIGAQVQLDAQSVQSVSSGISSLQYYVNQYINSATTNNQQQQQAINQLALQIQNADQTAQQAINLLISSIQSENISQSQIIQQLTNLKTSLSPYFSNSTQVTQNPIDSSSMTSQLSQVSNDYSQLINGNYWGTSTVALKGCWFVDSKCSWRPPSRELTFGSVDSAQSYFQNYYQNSYAGVYNGAPYNSLTMKPLNNEFYIKCTPQATNDNSKYTLFFPTTRGPLVNNILNQ